MVLVIRLRSFVDPGGVGTSWYQRCSVLFLCISAGVPHRARFRDEVHFRFRSLFNPTAPSLVRLVPSTPISLCIAGTAEEFNTLIASTRICFEVKAML